MALSLVIPEHKLILFTIIKPKFCDKARLLMKNCTFETWSSLKQHLLDGYTYRGTQGQWQLELNPCKPNLNEDVTSFSNRVGNCYLKLSSTLDNYIEPAKCVIYTKISQNQALNVFLMELSRDLAIIVKARNPDPLEDTIRMALNEDQESKSRLEISKYQNVGNSPNK
ncbi:hypothetical protein HHI36_024214 [Cryptolaemus montrouzieri]|uniref:Uncharacterized protein n=1 Tax=Cryptolaemus montrouzieri TaxID=559131 RepID=A0ABD2MMX6_9CUCU